MSLSGRLRTGGAFGYLLLVAVLTFGVFTMHTMGHPEHSSGPVNGGSLHTAVASPHGDTDAVSVESRTSVEPAAMVDHTAVAPAAPSADEPMISMDVLSVCVAVLTAWLLWVFLGAAARGKRGLTALIARAMAVLRPLPPPPRPSLVQLSVLRI